MSEHDKVAAAILTGAALQHFFPKQGDTTANNPKGAADAIKGYYSEMLKVVKNEKE
jgi:hypothetical protein